MILQWFIVWSLDRPDFEEFCFKSNEAIEGVKKIRNFTKKPRCRRKIPRKTMARNPDLHRVSKKPDTLIMSHNSHKNRTILLVFYISNCPSTLDTLP